MYYLCLHELLVCLFFGGFFCSFSIFIILCDMAALVKVCWNETFHINVYVIQKETKKNRALRYYLDRTSDLRQNKELVFVSSKKGF